jgi:hypothetical protein
MINFNYKHLGTMDISSIKNKCAKYTIQDWTKYDKRQKIHAVHRETQTIPLIWNKVIGLAILSKSNFTYHPEYENFKMEIDNLDKNLQSYFEYGNIISAILVKMPAHTIIYPHKDTAIGFCFSHRIHIPIVTDNKCVFEIDGEVKHLKEGNVYELNNTGKTHAVYNNSDVDRIHLLIDYKMKECDNVEDIDVNVEQKKIIWKFKDGSTFFDADNIPDLFINKGFG